MFAESSTTLAIIASMYLPDLMALLRSFRAISTIVWVVTFGYDDSRIGTTTCGGLTRLVVVGRGEFVERAGSLVNSRSLAMTALMSSCIVASLQRRFRFLMGFCKSLSVHG